MDKVQTTTEILDVLADVRLLPRAQFEHLVNDLLPWCDDWRILARELVYREWLTPFQARRLLQGRGWELLLGSYVIVDWIGEGGMGRVYRARNWKLGTPAAVKVIRRSRAADPAALSHALEAAGIVTSIADGAVFSDADLATVGRTAFAAGIALTELRTADGAGLEEMFLELTAESQRDHLDNDKLEGAAA